MSVIGDGRKRIWQTLLPCDSKSPTYLGMDEPLNKGANNVEF